MFCCVTSRLRTKITGFVLLYAFVIVHCLLYPNTEKVTAGLNKYESLEVISKHWNRVQLDRTLKSTEFIICFCSSFKRAKMVENPNEQVQKKSGIISRSECLPFSEGHVCPNTKISLDSYFSGISQKKETHVDISSFHYEWLRLQTFSSYPRSVPQWPVRLAQAGFFYSGQGDEVRCFSCGMKHSGWRSGDNAVEIHQQMSPHCDFIRGEDNRNVPIKLVDNVSILASGDAQNTNKTDKEESMVRDGEVQKAERKKDEVHVPLIRPGLQRDGNRGQEITKQARSTIACSQHVEDCRQETSNQTDSAVSSSAENQRLDGHNTSASALPCKKNERKQNCTLKFNSLGLFFGKPKYPAYSVLSIRLSTFQDWPEQTTQTPRELAVAGFLYAGYSDYVRCFFCGGGLRHWEANDDPWVEHAKWFPECEFVRQNKGDDFVLQVHNESQGTEAGKNTIVEGPVAAVKRSTSLLSLPSVQSVLEMGYSKKIIQAAIDRLTKSKDPRTILADELLDQVFILEEGTSESTVSRSTDGHQIPAAKTDGKAITQRQDTELLLEENEELKQRWQCKICMDKQMSIVFLPCGHLCCCTECAPAMKKCPICRKLVKGTVRSYTP